jgi:hypothetical protein
MTLFLAFSFLSFGKGHSVFIDAPTDICIEENATLKADLDFQSVKIKEINRAKQITLNLNVEHFSKVLINILNLNQDLVFKLASYKVLIPKIQDRVAFTPDKTGPPVFNF